MIEWNVNIYFYVIKYTAVCMTQTTKPIVLAIVVHIEWLFAETNSLVTDKRSRESVHSV